MITNREPCASRGARTVREGVGTAGLPHTMQRYLQYGTLQRNGLTHFDAWASMFMITDLVAGAVLSPIIAAVMAKKNKQQHTK